MGVVGSDVAGTTQVEGLLLIFHICDMQKLRINTMSETAGNTVNKLQGTQLNTVELWKPNKLSPINIPDPGPAPALRKCTLI